jgi:uncharacterized protein YggU (UPF0235/DUF167 family)
VRLTCRVHPRAAHERVEWDGAIASVWVRAPAAEGQANRAVIRTVARWLEVAPSRVTIIGGTRSRTKVVDVEGFEVAELSRR